MGGQPKEVEPKPHNSLFEIQALRDQRKDPKGLAKLIPAENPDQFHNSLWDIQAEREIPGTPEFGRAGSLGNEPILVLTPREENLRKFISREKKVQEEMAEAIIELNIASDEEQERMLTER